MTSQAIEGTFICEGSKQMICVTITQQFSLGTPLFYESGCCPLAPLELIFRVLSHQFWVSWESSLSLLLFGSGFILRFSRFCVSLAHVLIFSGVTACPKFDHISSDFSGAGVYWVFPSSGPFLKSIWWRRGLFFGFSSFWQVIATSLFYFSTPISISISIFIFFSGHCFTRLSGRIIS